MTAQTRRIPNLSLHTQGGAAYDAYAPKPVRLPDELPIEQPAARQEPQPVRVRAQMRVSLFSVIGIAVTAFLAVLVTFGYVRLYEVNSHISSLESELATLQEEQGKLQTSYESHFELAEIERQALALGMTQPRASQKIYLSLGASDHAQITPAGKENLFSKVCGALKSSVLGFVEYLS